MTVYNIFLLTPDKTGGFISDIVYADSKMPEDMDAWIKNLHAYKYEEQDLLVYAHKFNDHPRKHAEAKEVFRKWFHEIAEKESSQ